MSYLSRGYHRLAKGLFVMLAGIICLASVTAIAVQPSYAGVPLNSQAAHGQTKAELTGREKGEPLTAEERLDRAYSISEAAGLREEQRQAEGQFDPREGNESLLEKAKDAVESLTN